MVLLRDPQLLPTSLQAAAETLVRVEQDEEPDPLGRARLDAGPVVGAEVRPERGCGPAGGEPAGGLDAAQPLLEAVEQSAAKDSLWTPVPTSV